MAKKDNEGWVLGGFFVIASEPVLSKAEGAQQSLYATR